MKSAQLAIGLGDSVCSENVVWQLGELWAHVTGFRFDNQFTCAHRCLYCHAIREICQYPINQHAIANHEGEGFRHKEMCLWAFCWIRRENF
jgi:hypothetical protein